MKDRPRQLENDCLALLAYVAKHRDEPQTYRSLSEATGIPLQTLREIILWPSMTCEDYCIPHGNRSNHGDHKAHWALRDYGRFYGYGVRFIGARNRIIDVEFYGHIQSRSGRLLVEEAASKYEWPLGID